MRDAPEDVEYYAAMGRLTGYTGREHWAAHYPGRVAWHGGKPPPEAWCRCVVSRLRALGVDWSKVVTEMRKTPQTMFAAAWRTPDGKLHFYDGPNPSLQALRERGGPPAGARFWYHPESDCYVVTPDEADAVLLMSSGDGALCHEVDGCRAYLVRLEGGTAAPVARWDDSLCQWQRKKER